MGGTTGYDGSLQMFCEPIHEVDIARLQFLRWLAESGKLEHAPVGAPAGEYADRYEGRIERLGARRRRRPRAA